MIVRSLFLAVLFAMPFALAGTRQSPEITDAAGDTPSGYEALDIVAAWWETKGERYVTLNVQVQDLSRHSPLLNTGDDGKDTRYVYEFLVDFDRNGKTYTTAARCFIDQVATPQMQPYSYHSASGPGTSCTQRGSGRTIDPVWSFDLHFDLDLVNNVVVFHLREIQGKTLVDLDEGAVLGALTVRTWTDQWVSGPTGSLDVPHKGSLRDEAFSARRYVV